MKVLNKRYLVLVVAGAMGLSACGSDGKDGSDGEDGTTPPPPTVESSQVTNVEMISHALEEGRVRFEFEITNEEGVLITGLGEASAEVAALTEKGIQRSRDGSVGGSANTSTEGASLTMTDNGRYEFIAPMAAVNAGTEGLIRLAVGGGKNIAKSRYIVVDKTENIHTTSTATCQSCHVDFFASSIKHSSYTAINAEGETDLVAGCMACHNNVARDVDDSGSSLNTGGYAKNTLQKIGHINHQTFETGFAPSNCYTCHEKPITNVYSTQTCVDCHEASGINSAVNLNASNEDSDYRELHTKARTRTLMHENHYTMTGKPYSTDGGLQSCTDISLFNTEGETESQLDLGELVSSGDISVSVSFLEYYSGEIVNSASGTTSAFAGEDGNYTYCTTYVNEDDAITGLMAISKVIYTPFNDGIQVVVSSMSPALFANEDPEAPAETRRLAVSNESCTTCHNTGGDFHKSGSFSDGAVSCLSCHYSGKDRRAGNSAPGFGPMVHSQHWGVGSIGGDGEENAATSLEGVNCVACHEGTMDLNLVPNQYIPSKSYNEGNPGVATSPIMANCFACHNDEPAKNHMLTNGGELNIPMDVSAGSTWYTNGTSESCATCHAEGKTFGIEKFHQFER